MRSGRTALARRQQLGGCGAGRRRDAAARQRYVGAAAAAAVVMGVRGGLTLLLLGLDGQRERAGDGWMVVDRGDVAGGRQAHGVDVGLPALVAVLLGNDGAGGAGTVRGKGQILVR